MNSGELFKLLKKEAECFTEEELAQKHKVDGQELQHPPGSLEYNFQLIAKYDLKMFLEIKSRDDIDYIEDINPDRLNDFSLRIERYMDRNAPNEIDFKKYIRIVSIYLAFIVKKPLHPPGMFFKKEQKIIGQDNNFLCPVKHKWLNDEMSLCQYCVCSSIMETGGVKS